MGRNKKVVCEKCLRVMRSDNVHRHLKQHEEQDGKNETSGISLASSMTSMTTDCESVSNFSSVSTSYNASSINEEVLIKKMKMDDEDYKS